ncbi:uncharacterized protein Dyak_GE28019, partial [Drosophila yakuba]
MRCDGYQIVAQFGIGCRSAKGIIDTGATRSTISRNMFQDLRGEGQWIRINAEISLADGSRRKAIGGFGARVEFGGRRFEITFMILPNVDGGILLGMDFLAGAGSTLRCGGLELEIRGVEDERRKEGRNKGEATTLREPSEEEIDTFLEENKRIFENMEGVSNAAVHRIYLKDEKPIKQRYYPRNPKQQAIIDEQVDELLSLGLIERSRSPYSAPVVLVRKKNNEWRMCIDYRLLNDRTEKDAYPVPRMNFILDQLREAKFISTIDLKSGYWQIPVEEKSRQYTAFTVPGRGLFQWTVMPFGLTTAPATFQRALDNIIGPEMEPFAFAYLDDIIVIGRTKEEHLAKLKEVFSRLQRANLRINPDKCKFFQKELKYLGHVVSDQGIRTDPEKVEAIRDLPAPKTTKEVHSFLGMASWYRRFIPKFTEQAGPLQELIRKGKKFEWNKRHQESFDSLKESLTKAPVLVFPDFSRQFKLQTDASDVGIGAVLTQETEDGEHVISFASRKLSKAEQNYSATEKECLAIHWGIGKFKMYLEGYHFIVVTDHMALRWLNSIKSPAGRIARWALGLQPYQFEVQYRKGKLNVVADTLSRAPPAELKAIRNTESWIDRKNRELQEDPGNTEYRREGKRLYKLSKDRWDQHPWKLCVPEEEIQQILAENHCQAEAGHMGMFKTARRIRNKYFWPQLTKDVRKFVRSCESCQQYKVEQQKAAGKMLTRVAEAPWETVCVDFVGPLPRSKHGNTTLLVMVDKFSKWVELAAIRQATADSFLRVFRERIVTRYGAPKILISDNGVQFTGRKTKKEMERWGIRQQFTAPYTPQENPTERTNRTIKTMIAQITGEDQTNWDNKIPELMLAFNSSTSESTKYSPAQIVLGKELRIPNTVFDKETEGSGLKE